jgi:photosystem II stability/assembly factor-like uncharacterized protein
MKKTLLSLAVALLFGATAHAQVWTVQNFGAAAVPSNYTVEKVVAVNAATVWTLLRENVTGSQVRRYARTTDGGATWTGNTISIPSDLNVANITAVDANTAWIAAFATASTARASQGIWKTTDGGVTWNRQATAAFSSSASFPNGVYFWDSNNGVAFGDATSQTAGSRLEIYTTTNGGTTWTANNNGPQIQNSQEYGNAGVYFVLGNTIWTGGVSDDGSGSGTGGIGARIYKSTDRGLTWTSYITDLTEAVSYIAFTDAQRGIMSSVFDVATTTNGGQTNSLAAVTGNFRPSGLDVVPGLPNTYISVGQAVQTPTSLNDYGSSISRDGGATWTDLETGKIQFEIDMLSNAVGYTGGYTGAAANPSTGGMYKLNQIITSSRNSVVLKGVLKASPNPSNDGQFQLSVNAPASKSRALTVTDALGRVVYTTNLNASASQNVTLDLSKHKAGLYTLRLETEQGTAVEKLVIQ